MDLRTRYLGLELDSPLVVGSSPLADDLDMVRRLEDAGAAAIVMTSLFEEQLVGEQVEARASTCRAGRPTDSRRTATTNGSRASSRRSRSR